MPDAGEEFLPRSELAELQGKRLAWLLDKILPYNRFYAQKFKDARLTRDDVRHPDHLARLPFTTKAELLADQEAHPPYGQILTYPLEKYRRFHQTSGTLGQPLRWLDTEDSWNGMLECWDAIFRFIELTETDRLFFAFSFGPFLGFWTAFDAARRMGCLCLTGGGMSSAARLNMLLDNRATVLFCTPTYALRLAEVAREQELPLEKSAVRAIIVAGEPGGSIPAVRKRIEDEWQARVFDHSGMTEVGPMSIECRENAGGLHILEGSYLAEVIDPATGAEVPDGQPGELVVTNLTRWGSPVLRYRTGDLVRVQEQPCACGRTFRRLDGGILGRTDDMIHLRGINVYPSVLENVIRRFAEVVEYRITIDATATLPALRIELEAAAADNGLAERVGQSIRDELLFRPEVTLVPAGTLPRFEMKGRRIVHTGA
jgi:phenylacetate-CoA ligase